MKQYEVIVCGAGIAGVATAYYLARKHGRARVLLVDRLAPLSLTTSKSGENFRDYWPQACMSGFTTHSLELMQALIRTHGDHFNMRWSGYDFVSEQVDRDLFPRQQPGSGDGGLSVQRDEQVLRRNYPWLGDGIRQVVHIHRAGAIDVYALGSLLLNQARRSGVELREAEVVGMEQRNASGFLLRLRSSAAEESVAADSVVLAAGPFTAALAGMLQLELPVSSYRQHKFVIPDPLGVVPGNMPFTIFSDPQQLEWDEGERELIEADPGYRWLLEEFPPGLHIKPEGKGHIKLGWAYNRHEEAPTWEAPPERNFPDIVMRGAARFIPGLRAYRDRLPTPVRQFSGYYTRTEENWPLIGPLPIPGLFATAALSGYGTMAACAAGELCADHMAGSQSLPPYARQFHPDRYSDALVAEEISRISSDGQL